jgi:uncharacterized membrane protein YhaH (DUF805 family)
MMSSEGVMTFAEAVSSGFANYRNFWGRAEQSEFWSWILFAAICAAVTELVDMAVFIPHPGVSPVNTLITLILLLPSLAMMVRRLHDIGQTGWWLLLVPTGIGVFILLYLASLQSVPVENKYDRLVRATAERAL